MGSLTYGKQTFGCKQDYTILIQTSNVWIQLIELSVVLVIHLFRRFTRTKFTGRPTDSCRFIKCFLVIYGMNLIIVYDEQKANL